MLVFNPAAPSRSAPPQARHVLRALSGAVVGFIDNSKPNFSHLADDIVCPSPLLLQENIGVAKT